MTDQPTAPPETDPAQAAADRRRDLARTAVDAELQATGYSLPRYARQQIADAVLAGVDSVTITGSPQPPHPTDCRCACDGCRHHNAYPVPPADDLRELYAKAIYEWNNPGHRWEEAHPDDVLAYGSDADAILTVRDLELDQVRASREQWRQDVLELAGQVKAAHADQVALLERVLGDADHHKQCARLSAAKNPDTPELAATHDGMAAGLYTASAHIARGNPALLAQLKQHIDQPEPATLATGYCPHCGRGDAGPTADEYEAMRQRAERAEADVARLSTVLRLLPASAASLRGQIIEAICTWADHASSSSEAAADAVVAVMARHAALEPPKETAP